MGSLVKNIPIATFSLRGLLPFVLIVACIVALFFVPDVLKVTPQTEPVRPALPPPRAAQVPLEAPPAAVQPAPSPLDAILMRMERDLPRAGVDTGQGTWLGVTGEQALTWQSLKSEAAQNAISAARNEARAILTQVEESLLEQRRAIISAVALFELVLDENGQLVAVEEMVRQLEAADLEVAAALRSPGIDRALYLRWMDVSLVPAIQSYRSARLKHQLLRPFDPHLRLQEVDVSIIEPPQGTYRNPDSRIVIRGVVRGEDIKDLRVFRNGAFIQEVPFGAAEKDGYRRFTFSHSNAFGRWTILARDKQNNPYQKSYRFYPRIRAFPREGPTYKLPFDTTLPDPRLDRIFAISEVKGPEPDEAALAVEF